VSRSVMHQVIDSGYTPLFLFPSISSLFIVDVGR
jgi:hypothetical protein